MIVIMISVIVVIIIVSHSWSFLKIVSDQR